MAGWCSAGCSLLSLGLLSVLSGVLTFFPGGSFKPWFLSWDAKIAAPLWTGTLVGNLLQWEMAYTFSILSAMTSPLMFAVAMAAVLTGPLCYYSYLGAVAIGYLSHAAGYPYPYRAGQGPCLDPAGGEWHHLLLRTVDLFASAAIFILSLFVIVVLTTRLLKTGHVNTRA
ncbi:transmembrane protein 212-like [Centroberyx gerrardi]